MNNKETKDWVDALRDYMVTGRGGLTIKVCKKTRT